MKFKFEVTGIDCPHCASKLASMIEANDGIDSAKIHFLTEKLTVESTLSSDEIYEIVIATAKSFSKDIKVSR